MNENKSMFELLCENVEKNQEELDKNFSRIDEIMGYGFFKKTFFYRKEWFKLMDRNKSLIEDNIGMLTLINIGVE